MTDDWLRKFQADSEKQKRQQEANKIYEKRLAQHKKEFKCHVRGCKNTSTGPSVSVAENSSDFTYHNWSSPTGLKKCSICLKWTCAEHLKFLMCVECDGRLH